MRALGLARSPRVARLLRETGLYLPLRFLYDGKTPVSRKLLADLQEFRESYGPIFEAVSGDGAAPRGRVLFPHMSPGLLRTWVDGMLAKSLVVRGCEPVFVTERHEPWYEEYLRAFGFRDFLFIDDYLPDWAAFAEAAERLLADCRTQDDILEISYEGAEVGRHAASRVIRNRHLGWLELDDRTRSRPRSPPVGSSTRWSRG